MVASIEWKNRRVCVDYAGKTSDSEVLDVVSKIQGDQRFEDLLEALHDFSECDGCDHSKPTLGHIAAMNLGARLSNDKLRIAVVATHDDVKEMIRSFVDLDRSPYPLEVFNSHADADAWLRGAG